MPKVEELTITNSKADDRGQRLVLTTAGTKTHRDTFDVDTEFQRKSWRDAVIKSLEIVPSRYNPSGDSSERAIHSALDEMLQAAAFTADSEAASALWQAEVTTMADVQAETTEWLWEDYFPAGAIRVIDGDPGLGKSQLTIDLAARV